jgi:Asp-tRNA(Asn)/Glu-tRNA(Gln) amidotransferase A subunit family amidase
MGRRLDDATVLTLAAAFERAAPWKDRTPAP